MPKPERVYCDMEDNYPNFYLYDGWHRDKETVMTDANTQEGIKRICGKLGLIPVRIGTEKQYLNLVEYLNDSSANSENSFAIPIGYKWSSWPFEKFRSLDAADSPDLDHKLKKHIVTGFFKSLFGPVYDSLLLINSKDKLEAANLKGNKIRGVVCSENKEAPTIDGKNALEATCGTSLQTIK